MDTVDVYKLSFICPKCNKVVDIIKVSDYFEVGSVVLLGSNRTGERKVYVVCPICKSKFNLDTNYKFT